MEFDHEAALNRMNFAQMGASLKAQLADQPFEESPAFRLSGIFQVRDEYGNERTKETLYAETHEIFSRPEVQADLVMLENLSAIFLMECQFHAHGSELANAMEQSGLLHSHESEHSYLHVDEKEEKKKKDNKNKYAGIFSRRQAAAAKAAGLIFRAKKAESVKLTLAA